MSPRVQSRGFNKSRPRFDFTLIFIQMKLPIIKHITNFIEENDQDYVIETIETLESLTEVSSLKDEELDVLGEVISNLYGALEVDKMIKEGTPKKEALNAFMKRVLGSIDT